MSRTVASGTVTVKSLVTGREWDEMVEVRQADLDWADEHGHELMVEDHARRQARRQCVDHVETLGVDVS